MKINPLNIEQVKLKAEIIGVTCFWAIILFQFTVLKSIWGIETIATQVNLLMLGTFLIIGISGIFYLKHSLKVWLFYLLPGLMVLFFQCINITRNVLADFKILSYFGLMLPWATFIVIPLLMKVGAIKPQRLWKHYYYFMIVAIMLALVEYFLVLMGKYQPRMIVIPNGTFLSGRVTLFHMLEDGTSHDRFYACLGEPGDLAMFLLPALVYAYFYKKYVSLIIFLVALYFTRSLGGIIGLTLLVTILPLFSSSARGKLFSIVIFLGLGLVAAIFLTGFFAKQYDEKGGSRETREESISKTIFNLPIATVTYPLGMKLEQTTEGNDNNKLYFGSNFTPGFAFVLGGIGAFLGYVFFLLVSLYAGGVAIFRKNLSIEEKVVFSSLIVMFFFIFQRSSVWDTALFGLLFSPYILNWLDIRYSIKE